MQTLDRLAAVTARIDTPRAQLAWLVRHAAVHADETAARQSEVLADRLGNRFLLDRARTLATAIERLRREPSAAARASFAELAARQWNHAVAIPDAAEPPATVTLTERDRRLIGLLAAGATNADAAAALHVTEKAIEARLTRLYQRTGLRSRVELVREHSAS
jgi:DNA-binding CsgD family transcriptional regulator